ncbi:hypothetical protein BC751_3452 [Cecembia calidifontis]|uniref:Uncharacterized protein n=1 Tax=Cecembia calidifontis TaxID=1187080 RepID=A0A4Q7PC74_9BACT|nr:hypothetical protein BC751_3452 [Cecembia calidifontis]
MIDFQCFKSIIALKSKKNYSLKIQKCPLKANFEGFVHYLIKISFYA